ncbi:unnamed protein product [Victoria cruziana]
MRMISFQVTSSNRALIANVNLYATVEDHCVSNPKAVGGDSRCPQGTAGLKRMTKYLLESWSTIRRLRSLE